MTDLPSSSIRTEDKNLKFVENAIIKLLLLRNRFTLLFEFIYDIKKRCIYIVPSVFQTNFFDNVIQIA